MCASRPQADQPRAWFLKSSASVRRRVGPRRRRASFLVVGRHCSAQGARGRWRRRRPSRRHARSRCRAPAVRRRACGRRGRRSSGLAGTARVRQHADARGGAGVWPRAAQAASWSMPLAGQCLAHAGVHAARRQRAWWPGSAPRWRCAARRAGPWCSASVLPSPSAHCSSRSATACSADRIRNCSRGCSRRSPSSRSAACRWRRAGGARRARPRAACARRRRPRRCRARPAASAPRSRWPARSWA
jgi:hypothetical protein